MRVARRAGLGDAEFVEDHRQAVGKLLMVFCGVPEGLLSERECLSGAEDRVLAWRTYMPGSWIDRPGRLTALRADPATLSRDSSCRSLAASRISLLRMLSKLLSYRLPGHAIETGNLVICQATSNVPQQHVDRR
jgi:hypothetical protein